MPIPAELQSLLSELNISPPTKEHAPVETVEALIAAVTDLDCSFSKNLLIKDKKAGQPGQSVRLWRRRSSPFTPPLGASGGSLRGVHSRGVQPGHRARRAHRLGEHSCSKAAEGSRTLAHPGGALPGGGDRRPQGRHEGARGQARPLGHQLPLRRRGSLTLTLTLPLTLTLTLT